jgi:hypothetical protein
VPNQQTISDQLERWLRETQPRTIGSLLEHFGPKSFALLFVLLLAIPALPLPTGGVTHVLELVAMLLALELIAGRRDIWLPQRWRRIEIPARSGDLLLKRIRWLERFSRPRGHPLLHNRFSGTVFGAVVLLLSLTAFIAPPFTGLDTLPALGVVILSLGVLLDDGLLVLVGTLIGLLGALLVIGLGSLVGRWLVRHL